MPLTGLMLPAGDVLEGQGLVPVAPDLWFNSSFLAVQTWEAGVMTKCCGNLGLPVESWQEKNGISALEPVVKEFR